MQNIGAFLSNSGQHSPQHPRSNKELPPWVLTAFGIAGTVVLLGVIGFLLIQLNVFGHWFDAVGGIFAKREARESKKDALAQSLSESIGDIGKGEPSEYSAVFLTNKQVYFGKLSGFEAGQPILEDVYYLRTQPRLQDSVDPEDRSSNVAGTTADMTLIKLGNELHGPEDTIQLNRDHILFIERLREDSRVVQAILDYKKK